MGINKNDKKPQLKSVYCQKKSEALIGAESRCSFSDIHWVRTDFLCLVYWRRVSFDHVTIQIQDEQPHQDRSFSAVKGVV